MSNNNQPATNAKKMNSNIALYIDHISQYPLLNQEEMNALAEEVQRGNKEALSYMMLCNTRLVVKIAHNMQIKSGCGHVRLEDLIQYGNEGLYEACVRFNPSQGKFSSFAGKYIRHTIQRHVDNYEATIRVPISFKVRYKNYNLAYQRLLQRYQREPTISELSKEAGITEAQVLECQRYSVVSSLDAKVGDDNSTSISDLIGDEGLSLNILYSETELSNTIQKAMDEVLSEREKQIILIRSGLYDGKKHTLEEVGNAFGLSRERIRQIYNNGIEKIKNDSKIYEELKGYLD